LTLANDRLTVHLSMTVASLNAPVDSGFDSKIEKAEMPPGACWVATDTWHRPGSGLKALPGFCFHGPLAL